MRRWLLAWACAAALAVPALCAATLPAPPLPQSVANSAPGLRPLGEGRLTWLGLHVYDITLWSAGDRWSPAEAYALDIRYGRSIPAGRLVSASIDEMRRISGATEAVLEDWRRRLAGIFPDVKPGDRIVGVHLPGRGAVFHANDRTLGWVGDPAFADAFFRIWLDPRTREPEVREALLGPR